jgi:sirohydrochlorin ferrochelatase
VPDGAALQALVDALTLRLDEAGALHADGIVLAAAGSRDPSAMDTVGLVAGALAGALGRPCRAGYASGTGPGTGAAVADLSARGARRIAVASYFLAPGHLYDRAVHQALAAGAATAAAPLGAAPRIVDLILARAGSARPASMVTAGLVARSVA